ADELALQGLLLLLADLLPSVFLEGRALGQPGPHAARHVLGHHAAGILYRRRPLAGGSGARLRIRRHLPTFSLSRGGVERQPSRGSHGRAAHPPSCRPWAEVATTGGAPQ